MIKKTVEDGACLFRAVGKFGKEIWNAKMPWERLGGREIPLYLVLLIKFGHLLDGCYEYTSIST